VHASDARARTVSTNSRTNHSAAIAGVSNSTCAMTSIGTWAISTTAAGSLVRPVIYQGTFRERLGNIQGTFREHSGNV
jgi:hypothetical protein